MSLRRVKGSRKVRQTKPLAAAAAAHGAGDRRSLERAWRPVLEAPASASASGWDLLENRVLMAATPVIVYNFDEGLANPAATTVTNTGSSGATQNGTFATTPGVDLEGNPVDLPPVFGGSTDDGTRSPAGGSYVTFNGDGVFQTGAGGRIEVGSETDRATWLHPLLGNNTTVAYWIRSNQVSPRGEIWAAPSVTGVEHSGGADDVFFGDISPARTDGKSHIRAAGGNGAIAETTTGLDDTWIHVVHTRNATTGVVSTYVNGVLESSVNSETGVKGGVFRSIGALTVSNNPDQTVIAGYTHLNGDIDQMEMYNVVLTPVEVADLYGPTADAPPPAPVIAVTSPGPRSARLTWADVDGELGYTVLRSQAAGGPFTEVGNLAPGSTTFTDASVTTGQAYFYQVQAYNSAGTSTSNTAGPITIAATGNGLTAYYFNDNFWKDAQPTIQDAAQRPNSAFDAFGNQYPTLRVFGNADVTEGVPFVAFDYGNNNADVNVRPGGSPHPTIRDDNFSTLFVGKVVAPEDGDYQFLGFGDDDTYVFVNGKLVSGDPLGHGIPANDAAGIGLIEFKDTVTLVAGQSYDIQVMQAEGGGGAGVFLRWITPTMAAAGATSAANVPQDVLRTTIEAPQAATDLAVDAAGPDHIVTINFTDASTRELRYGLERSLDGGTTWAVVNDRGINATSITDNNPASVAAKYRVVAYYLKADGTTGSTPSAAIDVNPPTPTSTSGATGHWYYDQWFNTRAPNGGNATDILVGRNPDVSELVGDVNEVWGTNANGLYDPSLSGPGSASPNSLIRDDRFSTVFTGKIVFPEAGVYTILGYSDDDSAVWVGNTLTSSDPGGHGIPDVNNANFGVNDIPIRNGVTITQEEIDAGTAVRNFVMVQSEGGGGAGAVLRWITPSAAAGGNLQPQIVPEENLTSLADVPAAPGSLAAPFIQSRVVVLRWNDSSTSEVRYSVARAPADAAGNPTGAFTELAQLPINTVQYNDTTAAKDTSYVYRVRAENFRGVGESTLAVRTIPDEPVPATPTNLAVWNLNDRNRIVFTDNATNEVNFVIERRLASEPDTAFFRLPNTPVNQNGPGNTGTIVFTDADPLLQAGATYVYRVATINIEGDMSPYVTLTSTVAGLEASIYDADGREGARGIVQGSNPYDPIARVDPFVDFDFGNGAPDVRVSIDHFAIVWEGMFTAPEDGDFTFFGRSDDGMRVFLDGQLIVDAWVDRGTTETASAPVTLVAGQKYPIQVQYYENGGGAVAQLNYQGPTTAKAVVPTTRLTPPDATVPLIAPLSITAANGLADSVRVDWVDANINETGFQVQRSTDPTNATSWTTVATLPSNQQMYVETLPDLTQTFYYRVLPMNGTTAGPASVESEGVVAAGEAAGAVNFANFSDQATQDQWQLNVTGTNGNPSFFDSDADAEGTLDTLRLTGGATGDAFDGQTGSAFLNAPRHVNGFTSSFDFIMGGTGNESANPADGWTFTIHNDPRGATAVGGGGGALGWQGITRSVGLKFDVFNNIDEVGLYVDGQAIVDGTGDVRNRNLRTANGAQPALDLDNGAVWRVTLSYDPVSKVLSMSLDDVGNATTAPFIQSWGVDIPYVLGSDSGFVGFTAATGGESVRQDIKNFQFNPVAPAPLPTLSVANVTMPEGNTGTSNAVFTVTLSAPSTQTVRVNYATSNAGATAGASPNDYTSTSGTLTFAPGETSKTVNVPVLGDTTAEPNEAFFFTLSNNINAALAQGAGRAVGAIMDDDRTPVVSPVQVTQVFVNGQNLTANAAFRGAAGVDQTFGYPIPAGADQLRSLPWVNGINSVSLRFSQDVATEIAQGDLEVRGSGGTLTVTGFTYDAATKTATWTLGSPVTLDKLRLVLAAAGVRDFDGEWANGTDAYPSGDGSIGGDFNFRLNVLRGDATGDQTVNALDLADVKRRLGRRPGDGVTGAGAYSIFSDITMDGVINALDLAAVKQRLGNRLGTLPDPASLFA